MYFVAVCIKRMKEVTFCILGTSMQKNSSQPLDYNLEGAKCASNTLTKLRAHYYLRIVWHPLKIAAHCKWVFIPCAQNFVLKFAFQHASHRRQKIRQI